MKKAGVIILVLSILLVTAIGYIGYGLYVNYQLQTQISVYDQGVQSGLEQAVRYVFGEAAACKQIPLTVENITVNLIAVECLQG